MNLKPRVPHAGGNSGLTVRSTCQHGTQVQAASVGPHARLQVNTARSGSGARTVGHGLTWRTKSSTADLYRDEALSTITLLDHCRAR